MASPKRPRPNTPGSQSRAAELITVGWMLSVLTAFTTEVVAVSARMASHWLGSQPLLAMLAGFMLLASLVAATTSLVLLPVVLKLRDVPPPMPVIVFSIFVAGIPWIALLYPSAP
ncbi:MAG TPA: hypothetical protein VHV77_14695 [Pirellulales bacterium]|nr:hypothetical protein [Pirellulales bacterium]